MRLWMVREMKGRKKNCGKEEKKRKNKKVEKKKGGREEGREKERNRKGLEPSVLVSGTQKRRKEE